MSFYDELASIADDLLANFGQVVKIVRQTNDYDPVEGDATPEPPMAASLKTVWLPMAKNGRGLDATIPQSSSAIREEDRFLIASAVDIPFTPQPGDRIETTDRTWTVTGCTTLAPAGNAILFKIGVSQG